MSADPLGDVQVGEQHRALSWPAGGPVDPCDAAHPTVPEARCTRDPHPPWWLHVEATAGGIVRYAWRQSDERPPWLEAL